RGFVTIEIGIRSGTAEGFGPISGESLDVLRVEAMAERMCDDVIGHHPFVPGFSQTAQPFVTSGSCEDTLHIQMMTILSSRRNTLQPADRVSQIGCASFPHCVLSVRMRVGRALRTAAFCPSASRPACSGGKSLVQLFWRDFSRQM